MTFIWKYALILPVLTLVACSGSSETMPVTSDVTIPEHVVSSDLRHPVGSFQKSCENISVQKDTLSATCTKLDGSSQATQLSGLTMCLNSIQQYGDIGNIDGNLICLPDLPKVDPLLTFPTSETAINQWVYGGDNASIYRHAWGIWAGLTSVVGKINNTDVRAFETWNTTTNIAFQITSEAKTEQVAPSGVRKMNLHLAPPKRFMHKKNHTTAETMMTSTGSDTSIAVSVAYNPPAAQHAISNKLFLQSTLNKYIKNGYVEIPNFPINAITIKPVYKIISKDVAGGIYTFPGWPGTPSPAKAFAEDLWGSCIYVDINGVGLGGSSIDHGCTGRTADSTFHLSQFIHTKISAQDAEFITQQFSLHQISKKVQAGDYAILVGMHVTTRETKRWVWQTFWWSANAVNPYSPSSQAIANARPSVLGEAASHYAMAAAYQMVSPAQPITQGQSTGASVIAYNPHLEAVFDKAVFQILRPIENTKSDKPIINVYGVQSNCMTCHNLAQYKPNQAKNYYTENSGANRQKPYGTDYYMAIDDDEFNGVLRLDFAWSILGNLKLDDPQSP